MIKSNEDLESCFRRLDRTYEVLEDGTFLVRGGAHQPPIAVRLAPPVVVLQTNIGTAPRGDAAVEAALFRRLLELNATSLLHAAYGLAGDRISLGAALEADTLDPNELEAALSDMAMALNDHVPALRGMLTGGAAAGSASKPGMTD
ncbi:MAG: YbjN domain-containing protein [Polyangiaceae bacterium]|nr:YbjN domain-containing protein [Polyangiaceae bacterium]